MKRLAILSTHPIQYNAPLFRMLAQEESIDLKVFYSKKTEQVRFDKDFGQEVTWDVPLTDGCLHESFDAKEKTGRTELMAAIESFSPDALLVYGWNFDGHLAAMRHFHGSVPVWFRGDSTLLDPLPFLEADLAKALPQLGVSICRSRILCGPSQQAILPVVRTQRRPIDLRAACCGQ